MKSKYVLWLVLILAFAVGLMAWGARIFLMQNKVTFLLNQRDFTEAADLMNEIEKSAPQDMRTLFLQTKTLTLTGNFERAVEISGSKSLALAYPETLYWRALAEYQLGENSSSALTAEKFLQSKQKLHEGGIAIVRSLAGESEILDLPNTKSTPFGLLFPVEQAIYTGLAASQQMEIGRLAASARLFRAAFILENRNPKLLYQACKVNALVGYVQDAQMFFDYSKSDSILSLLNDFEKAYRNYRIVSLTLHNDDLPQGGRKIDLARALAWSANIYLLEDTDKHASRVTKIVNELVSEYPHDVVLQVRKAGMLKALNDNEAAMSIYKNLQQKFPNYTVLIRMSGVEGVSETELTARSNKFMQNLSSVSSVPLSSIDLRNGVTEPDNIKLGPRGSASASITVEERGSYIIILVGKGMESGGMWPLVKMSVDGEFVGVSYICRDKWDCYTVTLPLEAGNHNLELVFDDDTMDDNGKDTRKSFSLKAIYVALTGVADVQ